MHAARVVVTVAAGLLLVACTADEEPAVEVATAGSGVVTQTVAAPAEVQPRATARITAPANGRIAELLVDDGVEVAAGDPLLRISSDTVDSQLAQAQAAVDAAESLAASSAGAGLDLAPVLGAFRGQLDGVVPGILDGLQAQTAATEAGLQAAIEAVTATSAAADEWSRALQAAVDDAADTADELRRRGAELDDELRRRASELDDELRGNLGDDVVDDLDFDVDDFGLDLDELPQLQLADVPQAPDTSSVAASLLGAQQAVNDSRQALRDTEVGFADASRQLRESEEELAEQSARTAAAQAEAVGAQVTQAELALQAAESRVEALEVPSPIDGVVELSRGGEAPEAPDGAFDELAGAGGGGLGGIDVSALLGGGGAAPGVSGSGVVAEGAAVSAGQVLLTVYDTSAFTIDAEVDEIDVVELATGQPVEVLVDAFPGLALDGVVDHVAYAPRRDATGGALYGVEISLSPVADAPDLRAGLTASVEVEVRRVDGEVVVPTSALLRRGDGEVVHVVRDGVAVEVPVTVTAMGDEDAAVDGALEAGEPVVTIGVERISDGDPVPS